VLPEVFRIQSEGCENFIKSCSTRKIKIKTENPGIPKKKNSQGRYF